jgi:pimeloyl-ACP methyl ester carboxylesterase
VNQVIDQLLASRPSDTRQLILFGINLGAAVAAATAARRDDVNAILLESPFADFSRIVTAHIAALGMPTGLILRSALRLAEWMAGASFSEVRPVDMIRQTRAPLLVILGGEDQMLDEQDFNAFEQAVQDRPPDAEPAEIITAGNATHLMAIHVDPEGYGERIAAFLESADVHPRLGQ